MSSAPKKWTLLISFLVHIVFLTSIFDIYFKSPIAIGIDPIKNNVPTRAKRLILIVGDGLRSDSFFEMNNGITNSPYLRHVIEKRGRWGISHSAVPTESRPGHVALIAGFYEDPSAIFKGWKDNPVEFDSVFNQSTLTFGWGSPDVLLMFDKKSSKTKIFMNTYPSSFQEFSGTNNSAARLSLWVSDNFRQFLESAKTNDTLFEMMNQDKIVFFLHLLGIDTAGHSHKPHSEVYKENIRIADKIVKETEKLITEFFNNDDRSVFIFTSDHGMTDWGSHGEGSDHEIELPYVVWGSGIAKPAIAQEQRNPVNWNVNHLECNDINQIDIAPLMSILLGISIPVNSVGVVPVNILDYPMAEKSSALLLNARQMLAQFARKRKMVEDSTLKFLYQPFEKLSDGKEFKLLQTIERQFESGYFDFVIEGSKSLISLCSAGLLYYHNYYQRVLLLCISFSYIGWICWLLLNISVNDDVSFAAQGIVTRKKKKIRLLILNYSFGIIIFVSVFLLTVQFLPFQYYLYCCLPSIIWWKVLRKLILSHVNYTSSFSYLFVLCGTVLGTELVVLSFFERRIISVIMFFLMFWPMPFIKRKVSRVLFFVMWMLSCISLMVFPFLPVIGGKTNNVLLVFGTILWWIFTIISGKFLSHLHPSYSCFTSRRDFNLIFLLFGIVLLNLLYVSFTFSTSGLSYISQFISWTLLLCIPFFPLLSSRKLVLRLLNIYFCLGIVAMLFSVNHDALFLPLFSFHLFLWFIFENIIVLDQRSYSCDLSSTNFAQIDVRESRCLKASDLRRAFLFFFYILLSFFATGNIASINSFDTSWVRCFISVFAPFTMMILILIKIIIPFIVTACTFRAVNDVTNVTVDKIFTLVLVYCDIMGLNFLFLVRNVGSWLEIGSSVSHYVISQTIILFLVFLYFLSKFLTCYKFEFVENILLKFKIIRTKHAE